MTAGAVRFSPPVQPKPARQLLATVPGTSSAALRSRIHSRTRSLVGQHPIPDPQHSWLSPARCGSPTLLSSCVSHRLGISFLWRPYCAPAGCAVPRRLTLRCPRFSRAHAAQVDIDISANSVANYVTGMVRGATSSLVIDIGFVLEGEEGGRARGAGASVWRRFRGLAVGLAGPAGGRETVELQAPLKQSALHGWVSAAGVTAAMAPGAGLRTPRPQQ